MKKGNSMLAEFSKSNDYVKLANSIAKILEKSIDKTTILPFKIRKPGYLEKFEKNYYPDIAYGNAGILLFFIEHYKKTKRASSLEIAEIIADKLIIYCNNNPTENYSYLFGYIGVSVALIELYKVSGNEKYSENAIKIALGASDNFIDSFAVTDGLWHGLAGTLYGLLKIHKATGSQNILKIASRYLTKLLDRMLPAFNGIVWKNSGSDIDAPLGFAEGTSGISWIMMELFTYLDNPAFEMLAKEIIKYEDKYRSENFPYWPDLRKTITSPDEHFHHLEEYQKENFEFFLTPAYKIGLAFGTSGIIYARLKIAEQLDRPKYIQLGLDMVKKLEGGKHEIKKFSLQESEISQIPFLLELYRITSDKKILNLSHKLFIKFLNHASLEEHELNNQLGFLDGLAGIGYLALQMSDPSSESALFESICHDPINSSTEKFIKAAPVFTINNLQLKRTIINRRFWRTLWVIESKYTEEMNQFYEDDPKNRYIEFEKNLEKKIDELKSDGRDSTCLKDIFKLEKTVRQFADNIDSGALVHVENLANQYHIERVLNMGDQKILEQETGLNPRIKIFDTQWDWTNFQSKKMSPKEKILKNLELDPDPTTVLIKQNASRKGIQEFTLSPLSQILIEYFKTPEKIDKVIKKVIQVQEIEDRKTIKDLEKVTLNQIKEFIVSGILLSDLK